MGEYDWSSVFESISEELSGPNKRSVGGVEEDNRVDLSIIGLVAKEVEAEVAVGGVGEDLRNL